MKTIYFLLSLGIFFISNKLTAQQTTYIPDDNFEQALIDLGYDNILDNYVAKNNIITITDLDIRFKDISDLTGIESFTGLLFLNCTFNNLNNLDLSNNILLKELHCGANSIRSLDLSNNTALTYLDCGFNKLDVLDLRTNKALTGLYCDYNNLVSLDVKNGNNTNFIYFDASNNSRLTCIEVDNATYSRTNWLNKDSTSNYCDGGDAGVSTELTYVPDNNFEKALIALGHDDVLDDYVPTNNISGVTVLDVSDRGIEDLTGIASFSDLTTLDCGKNNLTNLDLSGNTSLAWLNCAGNNLGSLDLGNNISLFYLNTASNSLSSLDVSNNLLLIRLFCNYNNLLSLDVKNGNNTNFTAFNATNNPDLACIEVDDVAYSNSNWSNKDAASSYSTDCGGGDGGGSEELTYVPDNNFEKALIALGYDDVLDDYVPTGNISGVTVLDVSDRSIEDLTGIASFSALTTLDCRKNNLTNLDLGGNTSLAWLNCSRNNLGSLDLGNNISLFYLNTASNSLSSLDVSNNLLLIRLFCNYNNLLSLDVKNGNNTNFTAFNATNNPDLACIEVDDVAYSNSNWSNKDAASSYSTDCGGGDAGGSEELTYVPDNNFEKALIALGYDDVLDDYVPTGNISGVTVLDVSDRSIEDLTGIASFSALTTLDCRKNNLTNLDLGGNTSLAWLNCSRNNLGSLDLGNNISLFYLNTASNSLSSLDVSNNLLLIRLFCNYNNLLSLDVKNGNNTNFTAFNATNNPGLACIEVDDVAYSNSNWSNKDASSSYSTDCGTSVIAKSSNSKKANYNNSLSIEQSEINNFRLYPNPVKDVLNIYLAKGFKINQVYIYNAYGQRVLSATTNRIDVNGLSGGIYLVEIETTQGKSTKKIIIE
ncbi:T9SS type A sorting domain-containing protein [Changchengzhania lutea]|uniref:T9SS type A sorting domain-containing protein n=1 Tax=Changchengzhania lutea TaxID=2049305 RepID=UPI00115E5FB3|nr:T9SS type A sorting domain-containing protein [Changchengzhania lutea]